MLRHILASSLLVAAATSGAAQTVVTESDFLAALGPEHPAVAEAHEELAIARASRIDASAFENPAVEVVREDPSGAGSQTDLMVSWQLPDASRGRAIEAAEQRSRSAEARLAHALLSIRLEMQEIYAAWALASARAERLEAQIERVEALARRERLRADRGETSGLEAHRLQLAVSGLDARLALARAAEDAARARAIVWNAAIPADARPVLPELPPHRAPAEPHPLVVATEADLAAALADRDAASRLIRSPELMAGWQRQNESGVSLDGPLIGARWSIPLFRRNQPERIIADARVRTASARLDRVRREIGAERDAALARYASLAASVERLEDASTDNERMLRGAEAAFLHGEATVTDFLETLRSATEAELALLELTEAALAARRDLERYSGVPLHTSAVLDGAEPFNTHTH
jgi:outer membrane protein TolC